MVAETRSAALSEPLRRLAARQAAVVSRAQLRALGINRWHVRDQVRARRWHLVGPRVVVLDRGELTIDQRWWLAVLHGGATAALAGRSALAAAGLTGWPTEDVHVVVGKGTRVPRLRGVKVHESRTMVAGDVDRHRRPPRVSVERAAIEAASAAPQPRVACALLAAVVQQRLTTAGRLRAALLAAPRARYRRLLLAVLADIEGGAQALSEIDLGTLCRRAGLPAPTRQAVRRDRHGKRRYLDAFWKLADGRTLVVEIDGAVHLLIGTYWDDMDRQNELVLSGERVLRFPSMALRLHPERVTAHLRRALDTPNGRLSASA